MRDSHKSRSVRSLSVHACSAPVHELSELRSRPELWQRVHAARLAPGQKELVVVLDPPLTATCLSVSHTLLVATGCHARQSHLATVPGWSSLGFWMLQWLAPLRVG